MNRKTLKIKKGMTAQDVQDELFRRMSADKKIKLGSQLWRLAKELDSLKIDYGRRNNRPANASSKSG